MNVASNAALSNGRKPTINDVAAEEGDVDVLDLVEPEAESDETAADAESEVPDTSRKSKLRNVIREDLDAASRAIEDSTSGRRWLRLSLRLVAGLAALALLSGAGFGGWMLFRQHQRDVASQQALAAAEKYAAVLTSVDTSSIDKDFSAALDGATGEFKDMYSKSSTQLRQLLVDNKAAAHGTVVEGAVKSATPTSAVVLLFVDQSVTNTVVPDPRIDRSRIKMTMEKVDGRWLASKVELP